MISEENIKKELLSYVNEMKENKGFWQGLSDKELGSNNIRTLATSALNADSYEELRLFIEYKISKGSGWDKLFIGKERFGEVIIKYMDKIYAFSEKSQNDKTALMNISKFFGYLYWMVSTFKKEGKKQNAFR